MTEEDDSPEESAMRTELNVERPEEPHEKLTEEVKSQQWKDVPKETLRKMPKEVFEALMNQHR